MPISTALYSCLVTGKERVGFASGLLTQHKCLAPCLAVRRPGGNGAEGEASVPAGHPIRAPSWVEQRPRQTTRVSRVLDRNPPL